ncbi:hypothetical protein LCGC14_0451150 [marine sediment metagenome]|uniref:HNH nuclease domain-containing protein n=1 Tax=marine sediment metagenome TaxID=412755 RepID=A0A0F9SN96_9ZZZZ
MSCPPRPVAPRFWANVIKAKGCWGWKASKDSDGYGHMCVNGKEVGAHRISWWIHNGKIPKGSFVLHTCDNPICTNPRHLFLGNNSINLLDMFAKRRARVQA